MFHICMLKYFIILFNQTCCTAVYVLTWKGHFHRTTILTKKSNYSSEEVGRYLLFITKSINKNFDNIKKVLLYQRQIVYVGPFGDKTLTDHRYGGLDRNTPQYDSWASSQRYVRTVLSIHLHICNYGKLLSLDSLDWLK